MKYEIEPPAPQPPEERPIPGLYTSNKQVVFFVDLTMGLEILDIYGEKSPRKHLQRSWVPYTNASVWTPYKGTIKLSN